MRVENTSGGRIKVRFQVPGHRQGNIAGTGTRIVRRSNSSEMLPDELLGATAAENSIRKMPEISDEIPSWFSKYMEQFRADLQTEISAQVVSQIADLFLNLNLCDTSKKHSQAAAAVQNDDVIHVGVICDHCKEPVRGVRYKCGNCVDYNLCSKCELRSGVHSDDHVFLKIRNPACMPSGHRRKDVPLLKHRVYKRGHAHLNSPSAGSSKHGSSGCFQSKRERKIKKTLKKLEKYSSNFSDFVICNFGPSSESQDTQKRSNSSQDSLPKEPNAQFIRDKSSPDGACVSPGTSFTKCWRIKNTGPTMWLSDTMLKNYWGSPGLIPHKMEVVAPPLLPGEEGTVMVLFTAPQIPGCYQSLWRLHHKSRDFGDDIWCKIEVKADTSAAEPRAQTLELDMTEKDGSGEKKAEDQMEAYKTRSREKGHLEESKLSPVAPATPNNTPFDLTPPKSPEPEPKYAEPGYVVPDDVNELEVLEGNYSTDGSDSDSTASILSISSSSDYDADYVKIPINVPFSLLDVCPTPPVRDSSTMEAAASPTNARGEPLNLSRKTVSRETGEASSSSPENRAPAKTPAIMTLPQSLQSLSATALQYAPPKSLAKECAVRLEADNQFQAQLQANTIPSCNAVPVSAKSQGTVCAAIQPQKISVGPTIPIVGQIPTPKQGSTTSYRLVPVPQANSQDPNAKQTTTFRFEPVGPEEPQGPRAPLKSVPVCSFNPFLNCSAQPAQEPPVADGNASRETLAGSSWPPPAPKEQTQPRETPVSGPQLTPKLQTPHQHPNATVDDRVIQVLPDGLVNGVLTATASVYNTAKAIWTNAQQKEDATSSECMCRNPGERHTSIWSSTPTSVTEKAPPVLVPQTPMDQLIEMGFCDRSLNRDLLQRHNDDLTEVVAELIAVADNDWHANRHEGSREVV